MGWVFFYIKKSKRYSKQGIFENTKETMGYCDEAMSGISLRSTNIKK